MRTLNANLRRARRPAPKRAPAPTKTAGPPAQSAPTTNGHARVLRGWDVPATLTWYVHAHGPTVRANKESGFNHPLVIVRRSDRLHEMVIARHVELPGPSRLVHRHTQPLPETEQNAIAVVETTERPVAYFDPPGHRPSRGETLIESSALALRTSAPVAVRAVLTDEEWAKRAQRATHRIPR